MLPDPKKRKTRLKTSNCMFIGYASNSAACKFLVLKSDVLECKTITETKSIEFLNTFFHFLRKFLVHPQTKHEGGEFSVVTKS